ncbi:hemerythrin domain-containing protein [Alistipes onderdonkii]|uniref:hemerythrin domain-containing protein n=1 Tax=Alistipes onderdonkii TaxID=328813 RepID=UPI00321A5B09
MYRIGRYNSDDRMCDLVCDRYPVLLIMSRFGIALGFGDKTIGEVCLDSGVDTATFLAVVNMHVDDKAPDPETISVAALVSYLRNSHNYFLDFRLPAIRRKLIEAIDCSHNDVAFAILRFFDEYVAEVHKHMDYEEQKVFPYVEGLLRGEHPEGYSIDIFRRHHDQVEAKLAELKRIIIRYYPSGSTNELNGVLFDIFTCERDLASHNDIEDRLFIPAIKRLEERTGSGVSGAQPGDTPPKQPVPKKGGRR